MHWADPSVSGLYLPRVCIICSCCHSRHEWTHLWVGCICLECALYVLVVTLGMSGPIWEWAASALSMHYVIFLLSLSAWVDPSVSGLYLPRVCVICSLCTAHTHARAHTHLLSLIWSGAGHMNNFLGGGYTYVLITLLLQFICMTEENHREGQEQTNTTPCTPHVHPHSYKVQAYPNRALRQIFRVDQSRSEHRSSKGSHER